MQRLQSLHFAPNSLYRKKTCERKGSDQACVLPWQHRRSSCERHVDNHRPASRRPSSCEYRLGKASRALGVRRRVMSRAAPLAPIQVLCAAIGEDGTHATPMSCPSTPFSHESSKVSKKSQQLSSRNRTDLRCVAARSRSRSVRQPAWPGGGLERQRAPSLSSECRRDRPLDGLARQCLTPAPATRRRRCRRGCRPAWCGRRSACWRG